MMSFNIRPPPSTLYKKEKTTTKTKRRINERRPKEKGTRSGSLRRSQNVVVKQGYRRLLRSNTKGTVSVSVVVSDRGEEVSRPWVLVPYGGGRFESLSRGSLRGVLRHSGHEVRRLTIIKIIEVKQGA